MRVAVVYEATRPREIIEVPTPLRVGTRRCSGRAAILSGD